MHQVTMNLGDAANVPTFREKDPRAGDDGVLYQVRVGWRWRSLKRRSQWHFTTTLTKRGYPADAEFVAVWADCEASA